MLIIFKTLVTLFFIIYLSASITTMINPYLMWKIFESWKSVNEPSKGYFMFNRIIGGIATILGLFIFISFLKSFF